MWTYDVNDTSALVTNMDYDCHHLVMVIHVTYVRDVILHVGDPLLIPSLLIDTSYVYVIHALMLLYVLVVCVWCQCHHHLLVMM